MSEQMYCLVARSYNYEKAIVFAITAAVPIGQATQWMAGCKLRILNRDYWLEPA